MMNSNRLARTLPRTFLYTLLLVFPCLVLSSVGCGENTPSAVLEKEKAKEGDPTSGAGEGTTPLSAESDLAAGLRHEDLDATLWIQTSGEYQAITRQAYRSATNSLGDALLDPTWTACLEQQKLADEAAVVLADLPPAVVMDVDETVLDNSGYQANLINSREEYSRESWLEFCRTKSSPAVPGAVDFVNRCRTAGVQVLFVTNREIEVEADTRANLIAVGLIKESDDDILFCKKEQEDWKSDKIARRTHLSKTYRLLLLIGDDLHDFTDLGYHPTSAARREVVASHESWWGTRWVVMPNPNYGGWEQSTYGYKHTSDSQTKLELKNQSLKDHAVETAGSVDGG